MDLHLFSTDVSCMKLIDLLPERHRVRCLIVPSNRQDSPKVSEAMDAAVSLGLAVFVHQRGRPLESDIPPAGAAISWLYSQIISVNDLDRYPTGILNMHGGKIPEYRGASVLHWAIINGEDEMGVTWHELIEDVDAGAIWAESTLPIPPDATAADMRGAMIVEGLRLFPNAWGQFRNPEARPRFPDLSAGRVWRQRRPSDGSIGEGWSERRVRDMVRALCPPWPRAIIDTKAGRIAIDGVEAQPAPGTIPYLTEENRTIFLRPLQQDNTQ